jgi:hypothetical protein
MDAQCSYQLEAGPRKAPRIPASFWKFTLVLWRGVTNGNLRREHKASMKQFHVRADSAVKWTAAYSVSGLFTIETGNWEDEEATNFQYRVDATAVEWECFVIALNLTLENLKKEPKARQGNTGGFKVYLANAVDDQRRLAKLKPANAGFLNDALAGNILDYRKRPIAQRRENGNVAAIFYSPATQLQRKGESDFDYLCRCNPRWTNESWEDYRERLAANRPKGYGSNDAAMKRYSAGK